LSYRGLSLLKQCLFEFSFFGFHLLDTSYDTFVL